MLHVTICVTYVLHKDEKYCFAVLVFASYIFCFCITLYEMVLLQAWMGKMKPGLTLLALCFTSLHNLLVRRVMSLCCSRICKTQYSYLVQLTI